MRTKEIDTEYRAEQTVQERRKTANERELERFMEEERQKQITINLESVRKQKREQQWSGTNNILKEKNVFLNHSSILNDNPRLNSFKPMQSQRSMFMR